MRRRSLLVVLLLNVLVTLGVLVIALQVLNPQSGGGSPNSIVITVPVIVTATTDPNITPNVIVITATLQPGQVPLPSEIETEVAANPNPAVDLSPGATLPGGGAPDAGAPEATGEAAPGAGAAAAGALPENCILHVVEAGDTPFGIAEIYGADGFDLMTVNQLTEELASNLQIGQELIVPLEGCTLITQIEDATATQDAIIALTPTETFTITPTFTPTGTLPSATPTPTLTLTPSLTTTPSPTITPSITVTTSNTPTFTVTPSLSPTFTLTPTPSLTPTPTFTLTPSDTPTATLPPTAANAQVTIVQVTGVGDITTEEIQIRNDGRSIDLSGWTLRDAQGNTYTFGQQFLFEGGSLRLRTGGGENTPVVLFWGRSEAVLSSGDTLTLTDDDGSTQATFIVP
ncbi:MAG: LysM peptidoglycan-binding domain-containing protein [Chloroflexi bacterium]|nr:LysM peptidoglycan-binding domain-containing protein [Chloroflexota bacterium]